MIPAYLLGSIWLLFIAVMFLASLGITTKEPPLIAIAIILFIISLLGIGAWLEFQNDTMPKSEFIRLREECKEAHPSIAF